MNDERELVSLVTKLVAEALQHSDSSLTPDPRSQDGMVIQPAGNALQSQVQEELTVALTAAFASSLHRAANGISHQDLLYELTSGVLSAGYQVRFIRALDTSEARSAAKTAATLSGCEFGLGVSSDGTVVLAAKEATQTYEMAPAALTLDTYRSFGRLAVQRAKGQLDSTAGWEYSAVDSAQLQAVCAILHMKERAVCVPSAAPICLNVRW